jgi:hypothetical protein
MHQAAEVRRIAEASIADLRDCYETTTHIKLLKPTAINQIFPEYYDWFIVSEADCSGRRPDFLIL